MEQQPTRTDLLVIWRGKQLNVEMNSNSTVKDLGYKLQELTNVNPHTMRLLLPRSISTGCKMLAPFLEEYSSLSLQEISLFKGKPIRMMGVFEDEIEEVSQNSAKPDLRIAGFDEEEKRLRQRMSRPPTALKLPQGPYIFSYFRMLHIPGIELNPPPSEALRRMHMLACDPGIIAIMNKHRWRVGIMTEMAPVGYVGISPKCILGFNKNNGEEISLRLRTDDLKGFRKYVSIKKTLLHELAHMVFSEHDANFMALDKQLNQEAANLDWTKSKGHMLSGVRCSDHFEEFYVDMNSSGKKIGGQSLSSFTNARQSSVAAAYHRLLSVSSNSMEGSEVKNANNHNSSATIEPDPDDNELMVDRKIKIDHVSSKDTRTENCPADKEYRSLFEPDCDDSLLKENMKVATSIEIDGNLSSFSSYKVSAERDLVDCVDDKSILEPKPDDSQVGEAMDSEPYSGPTGVFLGPKTCDEPDPDDSGLEDVVLKPVIMVEPDLDDFGSGETPVDETQMKFQDLFSQNTDEEPDPDDSRANESVQDSKTDLGYQQADKSMESEPDPDDNLGDSMVNKREMKKSDSTSRNSLRSFTSSVSPARQMVEPDPVDTAGTSLLNVIEKTIHSITVDNSHNSPEDDNYQLVLGGSSDNKELQRIEDPVSAICARLQKAVEMLRSEVSPMEASSVIQTLFRIIKNVIEHPDEMKFRRLRKANPQFQRNVANYRAAMEVLSVVGFIEDNVYHGLGIAEAYMVLKRNDPGLLWLAKSSLEMSIA